MTISYLGHASFLLETKDGTRILTDPYPQSVLPHPVAAADVVTLSHDHFDHSDTTQVLGPFQVVKGQEPVTYREVTITCCPCFHDPEGGRLRGENRAYIFRAEGLKIVHLGDLGEAPSPALLQAAAGADVLFVPVGGTFTLTGEQAAEAVKALRPKLAVPMHFRCPGHDFSVLTTQAPFLAALSDRPIHRLTELIAPFPAGVGVLELLRA